MPRAEMLTVRNRCDFCCVESEPVAWVYYTHEESRAMLVTPTSTDEEERRQFAKHWEKVTRKPGAMQERFRQVSARGWAVCAPCADLIELRDVERLTTRARRVGSEMMRRAPRRIFREIWEPVLRDLSHRIPYQ